MAMHQFDGLSEIVAQTLDAWAVGPGHEGGQPVEPPLFPYARTDKDPGFPSTTDLQRRENVARDWPAVERRGANRPKSGDRRTCPWCAQTMRFFERYVVRYAACRNASRHGSASAGTKSTCGDPLRGSTIEDRFVNEALASDVPSISERDHGVDSRSTASGYHAGDRSHDQKDGHDE